MAGSGADRPGPIVRLADAGQTLNALHPTIRLIASIGAVFGTDQQELGLVYRQQ